MASAVKGYLKILLQEGILDRASFSYADEAIRFVSGSSKTWSYKISPSRPLKFVPIHDSYLDEFIFPIVYLDIEVDDGLYTNKIPPFKKLILTLEVKRLTDSSIIYRSHIDLANKEGNPPVYQDGPLYHLQFGGHSPGCDRTLDLRLKIPRWTHPPMDLILICETIVANFYPETWNRLKTQQTWKEFIKQSQCLCYSSFFEKAQHCLDTGRPLLNEMWAAKWGG